MADDQADREWIAQAMNGPAFVPVLNSAESLEIERQVREFQKRERDEARLREKELHERYGYPPKPTGDPFRDRLAEIGHQCYVRYRWIQDQINGTGDSPRRTLDFHQLPDPFIIPPLEWHAKGLLVKDTHGEIAGPNKSLKSYFGLTLAVGMMAAKPVMGRWPVDEPQKVLMLMGEGGENTFLRRVQRICAAYGVTVDEIRPNLTFSTRTLRVSSDEFMAEVSDTLSSFKPALLYIDPWYGYASTGTDTKSLINVGAELDTMATMVREVGASFLAANHMNQTGTGMNLTRITGAGHAEWCDSWFLLDHRTPGNVEQGNFHLKLEVGSRQWGGNSFHLDYSIGRFDETLNEHVGNVQWTVSAASEQEDVDKLNVRQVDAMLNLKRVWNQRRGPTRNDPLPQNEWIGLVSTNLNLYRPVFQMMVDCGDILPCMVPVKNKNGAVREQERFSLADVHRQLRG